MIRAIIFDLDNCLSAADELGKGFLEPVFDAIRRVNRGRFSDQALAEGFSDCWRHPLDFVAKKHGFTEDMLAAGWSASVRLEVATPMRGVCRPSHAGRTPGLALPRDFGFAASSRKQD